MAKLARSFPKSFLPFAVLFCASTLILYPYLQYGFNPDAIAYLRIASYYQKGLWSQAINAYWSPLLSWLLTPLFAIGIPWLPAFHILNVGVALLSLYQLSRILERHFANLSAPAKNALLLLFAALLLYEEYTVISPDLLTLCLLFFLAERYLSDRLFAQPLTTGLLGALLFFSKSYCFYFYIAFIGLFKLYMLVKKGYRGLPVKAFLLWALAFWLPSAAWMTLTHAKYGSWQVSGAAAYNYNNMDTHGIVTHPFNKEHKLKPLPYPGAYCLWEDPQLTYHYSTAKGLSHRSPAWYVGLLFLNIRNLKGVLSSYGLFWTLLLPLAALLVGVYQKKPIQTIYGGSYLQLLLFTALYVSGYLLILVVDRYIWIAFYGAWIFVIRAADQPAQRLAKGVLILIVTVYGLYKTLHTLPDHFHNGQSDNVSGKVIAASIPPGTSIASWHTRDLWTPFCAYDLHDVGGIASYKDWPALDADLRVYPVRYIILTDTANIRQVPADIAAHLTRVRQAGNWTLFSINR